MVVSPPSPRMYNSPKRRRDASDSVRSSPTFSPDLSRGGATLPEYPFPPPDGRLSFGKDRSPQSAVASQLKDLDLREPVVRQLAFFNDGGRARKRFAQMSTSENFEDATPSCTPVNDVTPGSDTELMNMSTLPESSHAQGTLSDHNHTRTDEEGPPQEPPEILTSIRERPRARNGSPTLDGDPEDNPLTWHESEITGHNPADPSDDGYGINGIGFKPTAAIAWARSQRRKQQVAEYKNREAREARQRRSERRRAGSVEGREDVGGSEAGQSPKKAVRVRFEDG
ncbi:MAG: hypothetical protein Q9160_000279 [Pyrenula sp. 1 TL-2023]